MKAIPIAAGSTPTLVCPAGYIGQHVFHNDTDEVIYIGIDGDDQVTTANGIPVPIGQTWFHEPHQFGPSGPPALYAVHGGAGAKALRYGNTGFLLR